MQNIEEKIEKQGELLRKLKSQNAKVEIIRSTVDKLLALKRQKFFKNKK